MQLLTKCSSSERVPTNLEWEKNMRSLECRLGLQEGQRLEVRHD